MNAGISNGNRQSETRNAGTMPYVYSPPNWLYQKGGETRLRTANGNTQSAGTATFTYDGYNRLATSTTATELTTYTYNALGERINKINQNGLTTNFHYGINGDLLFEKDQAGNTKEYVWLNGRPLARIDNGTVIYYYHVDHLGTPQVMTDAAGAIKWRADYEPFGKATIKVSAVENNLRLPGQYFDRETGLHYNYYRDYDPTTGRYVEADPIGLEGGINLYAYVDGNPMNFIDPSGLVKLYGSWCGPDWTGGFSKQYDQLDDAERTAALLPVDELDSCCQIHDIIYASCRKQFPCDSEARKRCFKQADRSLSSCSTNSRGDASSQVLILGNAKKRISNFMKNSNPDPGPNAASCTCSPN